MQELGSPVPTVFVLVAVILLVSLAVAFFMHYKKIKVEYIFLVCALVIGTVYCRTVARFERVYDVLRRALCKYAVFCIVRVFCHPEYSFRENDYSVYCHAANDCPHGRILFLRCSFNRICVFVYKLCPELCLRLPHGQMEGDPPAVFARRATGAGQGSLPIHLPTLLVNPKRKICR